MSETRAVGTGHVFVFNGDVCKLSAEAILIPCDVSQDVRPHWGSYHRPGGTPDFWETPTRRVSRRFSELDPPTLAPIDGRYVNTGSTPERAHAEWLRDGVLEALELSAQDLRGKTPGYGRAKQLVAMPLVGIGQGGFANVRGEALEAVLDAAETCVSRHDVDVAIACYTRSDYAALQSRRRDGHWAELTDAARSEAQALAQRLRSGQLVLFLGAGVSKAAGLPDFDELLTKIGAPGEENGTKIDNPGRRAELLMEQLPASELKRLLRAELQRDHFALGHGLLTSLRAEEAITTNFDRLYEMAAEQAMKPLSLEVVPSGVAPGRRPWLLKAHGDISDELAVVITASDFEEYARTHGPVASIIQATMMLSRVILFVGYSVRDPNVLALAEAAESWRTTRSVSRETAATVLDLSGDEGEASIPYGIRRFSLKRGDESVADTARRLLIFLDLIAWAAVQREGSWLLDDRYAALLDQSERPLVAQLQAIQVPSGERWDALREAVASMGRT